MTNARTETRRRGHSAMPSRAGAASSRRFYEWKKTGVTKLRDHARGRAALRLPAFRRIDGTAPLAKAQQSGSGPAP
jgi:hypothetical protein